MLFDRVISLRFAGCLHGSRDAFDYVSSVKDASGTLNTPGPDHKKARIIARFLVQRGLRGVLELPL